MAVAKKVLTNAEILSLNDVYIEVVPSPGPGMMLQFIGAIIVTNEIAGAYTNIDAENRILLAYGDWDAEASAVSKLFGNNDVERLCTLNQASYSADIGSWSGYLESVIQGGPAADLIDKPIKLAMSNGSSGNLTGGNAANATTVYCTYQEITL